MKMFLSLILGFANGPERKDFINEIGLMKNIAEGNNPHVVALIGCVTEKEPLCLITEYLPYGDLLSYLHSIRKMVMIVKKKKEISIIYTHTHSYTHMHAHTRTVEAGIY